ncbi:hypothetical protein F9K91_24890 [Brucella tritici]|uniref:Uncharacterized protein n=1 Tax=Brucella tritici TaxID=94626 RepID=A0A7X6FR51_9HYPH|nr:hypothetical protein [Brucella tritici]KAB2661438.1 hypothetical protein F9K91_24890 [Brucella tritici]NKW09159.1 hypothetical protein [Brucella tritici]
MSKYESRDQHNHLRFDIETFGRDLAAEMGIEVEVDGAGTLYPNVVLILGQGLIASLCFSHKADKKVHIRGYHRDNNKLAHHSDRVSFPNITVNPERDLAAIGRDIQRRLIQVSKEGIESIKARLASQNERAGMLADVIKEYKERFPDASINSISGSTHEADIYYNRNGTYLSGSIDYKGKLYIQRLSVGDAKTSAALMAALTGLSQHN